MTSGSGEKALEIFSAEKVDLVFLDVRMPGLDGLELLLQLRQINPQTPVIMLTAAHDEVLSEEAIKAGAREYIIKPFNVKDLVALAEKYI